jgi:hypothetical protein
MESNAVDTTGLKGREHPMQVSRRMPLMTRLGVLPAAVAVLSVLCLRPALSQVASTPAPSPGTPGWTFAVTPYFWLATVRGDFVYSTPRGDSVTDHVSAGINDYLSDLNFAGMLGAEARYDRFSLMTDGIFTSLSLTTETNHLGQINLRSGTIDIPQAQQLGTGTRTNLGVWGLAAGYTVLQGAWAISTFLAACVCSPSAARRITNSPMTSGCPTGRWCWPARDRYRSARIMSMSSPGCGAASIYQTASFSCRSI